MGRHDAGLTREKYWFLLRSTTHDIPVMDCGGISCGADALDFLRAGASAVQVGSAAMDDAGAPGRTVAEMRMAGRDGGVPS